MTKQRMAMRSNFPWSDFKKLGAPELSSSSSTSTALSLKNFEKRAHPNVKCSNFLTGVVLNTLFAASGYRIAMKICKDCVLESYKKQLNSLITI